MFIITRLGEEYCATKAETVITQVDLTPPELTQTDRRNEQNYVNYKTRHLGSKIKQLHFFNRLHKTPKRTEQIRELTLQKFQIEDLLRVQPFQLPLHMFMARHLGLNLLDSTFFRMLRDTPDMQIAFTRAILEDSRRIMTIRHVIHGPIKDVHDFSIVGAVDSETSDKNPNDFPSIARTMRGPMIYCERVFITEPLVEMGFMQTIGTNQAQSLPYRFMGGEERMHRFQDQLIDTQGLARPEGKFRQIAVAIAKSLTDPSVEIPGILLHQSY